eukprot:TRINITY_DN66563_c0_g1_i1.p1 TRINITY_DN66563_c0_g1~~TRINITY_DN66563_c0_g1_i1.p1  ORF type:complete len:171 (+),score=5.85 TRINITY_DN66563_c0_g1_i1:43-513(+)
MNPTCHILIAPASILSLAWYLVHRPSWPGPDGSWLGTVLFALAMVFAGQTLFAMHARRDHWLHKPFSPHWAAFTFPSATTCQTILFTYRTFFWGSRVFEAIHFAAFLYCNVVFAYVYYNFACCLPQWVYGSDEVVNPLSESSGSFRTHEFDQLQGD